ncbi:MAG: hypothetical protein KDB90_16515 [Planctomycetes bacterium]|nr:hypothetical protein [Planctomycetota bacterium]
MLKLPTNAGEWGFVIVLFVLFCGLATAVIYSQVQLHDMKLEQAKQDTEAKLQLLSEQVREYHDRTGKVEDSLTEMGVTPAALETRNADISPEVGRSGYHFTLVAELKKFDRPRCTLTFASDNVRSSISWTDD